MNRRKAILGAASLMMTADSDSELYAAGADAELLELGRKFDPLFTKWLKLTHEDDIGAASGPLWELAEQVLSFTAMTTAGAAIQAKAVLCARPEWLDGEWPQDTVEDLSGGLIPNLLAVAGVQPRPT
jgi:hypothetical protein